MSGSYLMHNPRCSKSRAALQLLRGAWCRVRSAGLPRTPADARRVAGPLAQLGIGARELLRIGEAEYEALGLADPSLDDATLIDAMVAHPRLIERPVFVHGDRAVIGRPPERLLALLGG